jgi:hypothetical protein
MIELKTREHLVYYMQVGMMKLSSLDLKFVTNLHFAILQNQSVTTNQIALFEKLVIKYQRQLTKNKISPTLISKLNWQATNIVPSEKEYTEAKVSIENNFIYFRSPFSKKFISDLRTQTHFFKWDKDNKRYSAPYGSYSLKLILDTAKKYYPVINYCDTTKTLLEKLKRHDSVKYWNPTLVKVNNQYMIAAINNHIHNQLSNITLNTDIKTLAYLSTLGVDISDEIKFQNKKTKFASEYDTEILIEDIFDLPHWLREIECDAVGIIAEHSLPQSLKTELRQKFSESGIQVFNLMKLFLEDVDSYQTKKIAIIYFSSKMNYKHTVSDLNITKRIKVLNNTPIKIS